MVEHDFKVRTSWQGGRDAVGQVKGDIIDEQISIPASLDGTGKGTNPDELLVSAASSCYIISLAATLERSGFKDIEIEQESIGTASFNDGKFKMESIHHYPTISISGDKDELNHKLPKLIEIADRNCMVSNAIRNNVELNFTPIIK